MNIPFRYLVCTVALSSALVSPAFAAEAPLKSFLAPHAMTVTVKEIGPVTQTTDLQILCIFKHGEYDQYIEAMQDFNDNQGKLISTLRGRGEFIGELGETFLYVPPAGSITPARVLLIGVGDAKSISLDRLRLAGRIAAREAVRLEATHVSFAPTLRDQGSHAVDVGDGDAAVVEQMLLAYDTEKRLQAQHLAPNFSIDEWVIEAGPKYFEGAAAKVGAAVEHAKAAIAERDGRPYATSPQ